MHELIKLIAKDLIIVPILVAVYLLWKLDGKARKNFLALLILGGALSLVLAKVGAHFYSDPRPLFKDHVTPYFIASHYNGFPSDHTLLASFLGFATLTYRRQVGYILLLVAAIIGWARVAAGVHHFVDIIGSFLFTALATLLAVWLLNFWQARSTPKKTSSKS